MTITPITPTTTACHRVAKFAREFPELTQDRLKELLDYDPETGIFTRKVAKGPRAARGSTAGFIDPEGYVVIRVDMRSYRAHRLAFLWMSGKWPKDQVDHINRRKGDNRWTNLREADAAENAQNRKVPSNNTSGSVGVVWHKGKRQWMASLNGKFIGYFESLERASQAYAEVKKQKHRFHPDVARPE